MCGLRIGVPALQIVFQVKTNRSAKSYSRAKRTRGDIHRKKLPGNPSDNSTNYSKTK